MANFIQLLIGIILILTFVSLVNVNSFPTEPTVVVIPPNVVNTLINKDRICYSDTDCNGHGKCHLNKTGCDCYRGWTTYGHGTDSSQFCAYKQRSKQTAFFLSLFAGIFGADWFYLSRGNLGYIIAGILKLLLGCGCCSSWPLTYFGPELQNSESVKAKLRGVSTCFSLLEFAWWVVDWARILGNKFPDGSGAGLIPW